MTINQCLIMSNHIESHVSREVFITEKILRDPDQFVTWFCSLGLWKLINKTCCCPHQAAGQPQPSMMMDNDTKNAGIIMVGVQERLRVLCFKTQHQGLWEKRSMNKRNVQGKTKGINIDKDGKYHHWWPFLLQNWSLKLKTLNVLYSLSH